jgi:hypothetical protein
MIANQEITKRIVTEVISKGGIYKPYTPQKGDVIVKIVGEVGNPHNTFGEKIDYKTIVRFLLVDNIHFGPNFHYKIDDVFYWPEEGWYWGYHTVHKASSCSWLEDVEPDITIEAPVYEVGAFEGIGRHDEKIIKTWGKLEEEMFYVGGNVNFNNAVSYFLGKEHLLNPLSEYYQKNRGFRKPIPPDRLIHVGSIVLIEPWGVRKK